MVKKSRPSKRGSGGGFNLQKLQAEFGRPDTTARIAGGHEVQPPRDLYSYPDITKLTIGRAVLGNGLRGVQLKLRSDAAATGLDLLSTKNKPGVAYLTGGTYRQPRALQELSSSRPGYEKVHNIIDFHAALQRDGALGTDTALSTARPDGDLAVRLRRDSSHVQNSIRLFVTMKTTEALETEYEDIVSRVGSKVLKPCLSGLMSVEVAVLNSGDSAPSPAMLEDLSGIVTDGLPQSLELGPLGIFYNDGRKA